METTNKKSFLTFKSILICFIIIWVVVPSSHWFYKKSIIMDTIKPGQVWVYQKTTHNSDPFKRCTTTKYRLILDKKEGFVKYIELYQPEFNIDKQYITYCTHSSRAIFFIFHTKLYKP